MANFEKEKLINTSGNDEPFVGKNEISNNPSDVFLIITEKYYRLKKYFDTSEHLPYMNYTESQYDSTLSLHKKIWWTRFRVKLILGLIAITTVALLTIPVMIMLRKSEP